PSSHLLYHDSPVRETAETTPTTTYKPRPARYAPNHNPAAYYTRLSGCRADDVPLGTPRGSALLRDFSRERTAPAVGYVTGNLCDDMHGAPGCRTGRVRRGDTWLSRWIPLITSTPVYRAGHTVIFLVWDAGAG